VNPSALISHPLAVNDLHFVYPYLYTLPQILLQEGWDFLGGKDMEVYAILDGNPYRILGMMAFPRHPNGALRALIL
jgi:hypothetical protein